MKDTKSKFLLKSDLRSRCDSQLYRCSQLRSYSNHSQDTGCTIMDDCMTKASDVFPTQTQIETLNSSAEWLECATCPCNKQTLCNCHTRGQEPRPHKEFTTAGNIHLISNISEWKLIILLQGVSNPGEINYYLKKKCQNKIGLFVKNVSGICETWKNCRKVTC